MPLLGVIGNDHASSLRVQPGYRAKLFNEGGFWGASGTFDGDTAAPTLLSPLNNNVSSLVVTPGVTVYQNVFGGWRQTFVPGSYPASALTVVGNNAISSLAAAPGIAVRLCSESGGWGDCREFTGRVPYVGDLLNDRTSWLQVSPLLPPAARRRGRRGGRPITDRRESKQPGEPTPAANDEESNAMKRWTPLALAALSCLGSACAEEATTPERATVADDAPTAVITARDVAALAAGEALTLSYKADAQYEFRAGDAPLDFSRILIEAPDGGTRTMAESLAQYTRATGDDPAFFQSNTFRFTTPTSVADGESVATPDAAPPGLDASLMDICHHYECYIGECGCVHCIYFNSCLGG